MSWQWREDLWLSARMGRPVLQLCGADTENTPPQLTPQAQGAFSYARVPVHRVAMLHTLTKLGFTLVDTAITLECNTFSTTASEHDFSIRHARQEDKETVSSLARTNYHLTRFHQDSVIPRKLADAIQSDWAANFFNGGRGDFMLVGEKDGMVQGFLLALTPDVHTLVVDLIAVAARAQGQGLGRALMNAAHEHSLRPTVRAGTQLANKAALAFYQCAGLHVCHAAHTVHRHPNL